jgi:hypothetical protein
MVGTIETNQRIYGKRSWTRSNHAPTNYLSTTKSLKTSLLTQSPKDEQAKKKDQSSNKSSGIKNISRTVNYKSKRRSKGREANKLPMPSIPSVIEVPPPATPLLPDLVQNFWKESLKLYPYPHVRSSNLSYLKRISPSFEKRYMTIGFNTTGQNNNCLYHSVFSCHISSTRNNQIYLPIPFVERVKEFLDHDKMYGKGGMPSSDVCGVIAKIFGFNIAISSVYGVEFYIGDCESDRVTFIRHVGAHFEPVRMVCLARKLPDQDALVASLTSQGFTPIQVAREYYMRTGSPIVTQNSLNSYVKGCCVNPKLPPEDLPEEIKHSLNNFIEGVLIDYPQFKTPAEDDVSLCLSNFSDSFSKSLLSLEGHLNKMQGVIGELLLDDSSSLKDDESGKAREATKPHVGIISPSASTVPMWKEESASSYVKGKPYILPPPSELPKSINIDADFDKFIQEANDLLGLLDAEIAKSPVEPEKSKTGEDKCVDDPGSSKSEKSDMRSKGFPQVSNSANLHRDLLQEASVLYETHPIGRFFPDKPITKQVPEEFDKEGKCTKTKNVVMKHVRALPDFHCSSYGYNYMQADPEMQSSLPVKIVDLGSHTDMHKRIVDKMGDNAQYVDVGAYAYAKTQMIGKPVNLNNKTLVARHLTNYFSKFDLHMIDPVDMYLMMEHTTTAVMHINDMEISAMQSLSKTKNLRNVTKLCNLQKGMVRKTFFGIPLPSMGFKIIKNLSYPVKMDK